MKSNIWITNYTRWPWLIFLWMNIPDLWMIHCVHGVHLARVKSHNVKYCSMLQLFVPIKWWILSVSFNSKMYLFAFLWSLYAVEFESRSNYICAEILVRIYGLQCENYCVIFKSLIRKFSSLHIAELKKDYRGEVNKN